MTSTAAREKALACVKSALDRKASDVALLEVAELTSLADYFLICSGRSDTQVQAIANSIEGALKKRGVRPLSIEGFSRGQWVILDYGDVIVHVFYEPVREFYDLERFWSRAPRVPLPEPERPQTGDLHPSAQAR